MKSSVVSVLGDDFILGAELRGLRPLTVARYIARNAMLPLFTILALSIGFMFGGSIFIEEIFDYPGLGYALLTSIGKRDYPLMTGAFLIITVAVIVANILADLLYEVIDPRVRRI
jgi:peptide/nickel transport system permease protein